VSDPVLLGIDAGGSRVRAVAVAGDRRLHSGEGGPSGAVGTDPAELVVNLGRALAGCPQPEIVVACAAGAGGEAGRERIEALLAPRFPGSELHVLPDYAAAWAAAPAGTELLVIAGTGSAVCGEDVAGELRAAGGLGWIAGDHGSAARLGRSLLEEVARPGGDGLPDGLEEGLESVFGAARPAEIAARLHAAAAPQALLAAAAPLLTAAAERGGERAVELLEAEMLPLARTATVHLERLRGPTGERAGEPARMVLAGGVLTSAAARDAFIAGLGRLGLEVEIGALERRPVEGALRLAGEIAARTGGDGERPQPAPGAGTDLRPPTERPNRRSRGLGEMSAAEVVALMDAEEPRSLAAVAAAAGPIVTAAERVAALCSEGGRIVLLGSGTSGRIALTEAAELRPTFGVPEQAFSAYVAGGSGPAAIAASEDDEAAAPAKLRELGLGRGDGVIGLAASGSTPFVLAGITAAREAGAWT
jgi:N-acetylglucosamine kinase-like BadF-type ATPase/phosphoheptose isomerase